MSQPLVTIITPTYNKPHHFAECAAAVLAQKFTDWVWWVVFNAPEFNYNYWRGEVWNDPRVSLILYPATDDTRRLRHVPAAITNWLYPKITTPYIYFLADDDLIDPDGLAVLVDAMQGSWEPAPDFVVPEGVSAERLFKPSAVYGHCDILTEQPDGSYTHAGWLHPGDPTVTRARGTDISGNISSYDIGLGTGIQPDCLIDGGQVLHTKALWDRAKADGWQLDTRPDEEHASHNDGTLLNRLAEFARFHYVPQRIVTHRRTRLSRWHKPLEAK